MNKFFRKIRQILLSEGNTRKYFKYALGEIVLVMIGILLALQVNNWNDNRIQKNTENQYYCRILEDFEIDIKQLDSIQTSVDNSIRHTNEVLLALDSGNKTRNFLLNKYILAIRRDIYIPTNKTFEELIFSGNLNILNDPEIKNALIQFNSHLESYLTVIKKNRDAFVNNVYDFTNSSINFGVHELKFVNDLMTPEVIKTLPEDNWTHDKNSKLYKHFQRTLLFNLATAGREKDVLNNIAELMKHPHNLLMTKCKNQH